MARLLKGDNSKTSAETPRPRRLSFKTKTTAERRTSSGGVSSASGSVVRVVKVTLPSNSVAALASKFNAVIVEDEIRGRALLKKKLVASNRIREAILKFEGLQTPQHQTTPMVVVRKNSSTLLPEPKSENQTTPIVLVRKNSSNSESHPKTEPPLRRPKPKTTIDRKSNTRYVTKDLKELLGKDKRFSLPKNHVLDQVFNEEPKITPNSFPHSINTNSPDVPVSKEHSSENSTSRLSSDETEESSKNIITANSSSLHKKMLKSSKILNDEVLDSVENNPADKLPPDKTETESKIVENDSNNEKSHENRNVTLKRKESYVKIKDIRPNRSFLWGVKIPESTEKNIEQKINEGVVKIEISGQIVNNNKENVEKLETPIVRTIDKKGYGKINIHGNPSTLYKNIKQSLFGEIKERLEKIEKNNEKTSTESRIIENTQIVDSDRGYEVIDSCYELVGGFDENSYDEIGSVRGRMEAIYDVVATPMSERIYESIYNGRGQNHDSDSSSDLQSNSLYELRPPSQASSGGGGGGGRNSQSDTSDEWVDLEPLEEPKEEILVLQGTPRHKSVGWTAKVRRQWSLRSAAGQGNITVAITSTSILYIKSDNDCFETDKTRQDLSPFPQVTLGLVSFRNLWFSDYKYEIQEVTIFISNKDDSDSSSKHYELVENVDDDSAVCDDFDDSSESEFSDANNYKPNVEERLEPALPQTEGIYGLMREAKKRMRQTSSSIGKSLRRISRMSRATSAQDIFGTSNGSGGLPRGKWPSFKKKTTPQATSTFYLNSSEVGGGGGGGRPTISGSRGQLLPLATSQSASTGLDRPPAVGQLPPQASSQSVASGLESSGGLSRHPPSTTASQSATGSSSSSSLDPRRLSVSMRPSAPPPPPPVNQANGDGKLKAINDSSLYTECGLFEQQNLPLSGNNSNSTTERRNNPSSHSWYSEIGLYENSRSSLGDTASEHGSSQGSDMDLRFADEPLYQFYTERVAKEGLSEDALSDRGYEEIGESRPPQSRPSALDLVSQEMQRTLWCQVPQVIQSGILDTLSPERKRLQEAKFEVVTSEASYYKSLTILEKHFAASPLLKDESVLPKVDYKTLFGNVSAVRKCSEAVLAALEKCWQESILLEGLSDVINDVAERHFTVYKKYCTNQLAIERTVKTLKKTNSGFAEALESLQKSPVCHNLSFYSFVLLPMQRITRMPLLQDAILTRLTPDDPEYESCRLALARLNKIVHDCNEAARQSERMEEMILLSRAITFPTEIKRLPLLSASRWLVRSGDMTLLPSDSKATLSKRLATAPRSGKLRLFLFTDYLLVTKKKKGEDNYVVVTYCERNLVQMSDVEESIPNRFLIMLTLLQNHEGKTQEMVLCCGGESSRARWTAALSPPEPSSPGESVYEDWDCPQVCANHPYLASQPDELQLQSGDVINVLRKTADGWYYGERLRDGERGWFPGNHTVEILSAHLRARNLKQRYRLLALSNNFIQQQLNNKPPS